MISIILAAFAIVAGIVGAGFATGREIVAFFSSYGWGSWAGVVVTALMIGLATSFIIYSSSKCSAESISDLFVCSIGSWCKRPVKILFMMLMLMTASVMIAASGELFALALDIMHAYELGVLVTCALALILALNGFKALGYAGMMLVPCIAVYYFMIGNTQPVAIAVGGSLKSLPNSVSYAMLNVALASGVMCQIGKGVTLKKSIYIGSLTGGTMLLLLGLANSAMVMHAPETNEAVLPSIVLAARLGINGYSASIAVLWVAVITTLVSSIIAILDEVKTNKAPIGIVVISLGIGLSALSFGWLVNVCYPIMGIVCALLIGALIFFNILSLRR